MAERFQRYGAFSFLPRRRSSKETVSRRRHAAPRFQCETLEQRLCLSVETVYAPYEVLARVVAYADHKKGDAYGFIVSEGASQSSYSFAIANVFDDPKTGFHAYAGQLSANGTSAPVVVFRGTVPTNLNDWAADLNPQGIGKPQVDANLASVTTWITNQSSPVSFTGQSLGGALAQWFAAETPRSDVSNVVTFNSPGVPSSVATDFANNVAGSSVNVMHFINSGDTVSLAGEAFIPGSWTLTDLPHSTITNVLTNHLESQLYQQNGTLYTARSDAGFDRIIAHSSVTDLNSPLFNYFSDWEYSLSAVDLVSHQPAAAILTTRIGVEATRSAVGAAGQLIGNVVSTVANEVESIVSKGWNAIQKAVNSTIDNVLVPLTNTLSGPADATIYFSDPTDGTVSFSGQGNNDVVIVIDQSGSMDMDNKMSDAQVAADSFVNQMNVHDKIAVVGFSDAAATYMPLTDITGVSVLDEATQTIDSLATLDNTSIGAGLQSAAAELARFSSDPSRAIVLLTDGQENTSPWAQDVINSNVPSDVALYTIGFGSDADATLLQSLAAQRHGQYYAGATLSDLQSIYLQISAKTSGAQQDFSLQSLIQQGQTLDCNVSVPGDTYQQVFRIDWPGSDLNLAVIDPRGRTWDASNIATNPNMRLAKQGTYEILQVTTPQAGAWHMRVTGTSVSAGGENFSAIGLAQPLPAGAGLQPQVAAFTARSPLRAFYDTVGNLVRIGLSGAGSGLLTYALDARGNRVMQSLAITGSDASTSLSIQVTPGRGQQNSSIGSILIDGNAKAISASQVVVNREVLVNGIVPSISLGDCSGCKIDLASRASRRSRSPVAIQLGSVTNCSVNTHAMPISRLTLANWASTGAIANTITAPTIGTLSVSGRKLRRGSLAGDFAPDVTLSALSNATIAGSVSGTWNVSGSVGAVAINGNLTGTLNVGALSTLKVGGAMSHAALRSAGSIGSVRVGALLQSRIYAGVSAAVTGLPTAISDFKGRTAIGSLTIAGVRGLRLPFVASDIAAYHLGSLSLNEPNTNNGGTSFGLAMTQLDSVVVYNPSARRWVHWTRRMGQSALTDIGDLSFNFIS